MNILSRCTLAATLGLCAASFAAKQPSNAAPKLADIALANFDRWNTDGNDNLSTFELAAVIADAKTHGDVAAAAVAIFNFERQETKNGHPVTVTKAWLATSPAMAATKGKLSTGEETGGDTDNTPAADPKGPPVKQSHKSPAAMFEGASKAIGNAPATLYSNGGMDFTKVHQGGLGDCYFISMIGADVYQSKPRAQSLITPKHGGGYTVHWGDGVTSDVTDLTDGEKASAGAGMGGGLWVRVLEKALTQRAYPLDEDSADETHVAASALGGGSPGMVISLLTGHVSKHEKLFQYKNPSPAELNAKLATLRPIIIDALSHHHLLNVDTAHPKDGQQGPPPGINSGHAYAILAYDPKQDVVTVWNPHANKFDPKGTPGLQFGYPTADGVFQMPLKECATVFSGFNYETEEHVQHDVKVMTGAKRNEIKAKQQS